MVDGNETRWKVYFARGEYADRPIDAVFVDADSPRQAKLKAAELFSRELNVVTLDIGDLEATATTQDAGRPEVTWNIINGLGEPAGTVNARTSDEALHVYGSVNNVDTRYYRATPAETASSAGTYTSFADAQAAADRINAGGAENAVRDSLPQAHREWLDNVADKSDMDLINVLRNVSTTAVLNDQQTAYFRVIIKRELRRRGISDSERDASERDNMTSPDDETIDDIMGSESDETGLWTIGNHTYGRETFRANSRDEAIQAYAERNGISVNDLTSDRSFVANLAQPRQTNESIKDLRRLAGLV